MPTTTHAASAGPWRRVVDFASPSRLALGWLWLAIALAWMLIVVGVYRASDALLGPVASPFTPADFAWGTVANGVLIGVLVAGHTALRRGVASDLNDLRSILPAAGVRIDDLAREIADPPRAKRLATIVLGLGSGWAMATLDPVLRGLHVGMTATDPRYLLFVLQNMLFGWLGVRLFATEVHMTRAYARLGERVDVDLLDRSAVLVFGRKGLRSVAVWVLTSTAVSMFWVLESAGQANAVFPFAMLGVTVAALLAPTLGVRRNIARKKAIELEVVTRAIRTERDALLGTGAASPVHRAGVLADLLQYEAFVRSIREWPFDLSIVSRSLLFIVLGCGSWLGGALVERLLGAMLD